MKVILSRKGFDETSGGKPSPILPDGTLLSLPIPADSGRAYSDLHYDGLTYADIIKQLAPTFCGGTCHLDPDIRQGVFNAPSDWKPAFGQCGIPLKTLNNQGVGVGDLFLFFGWFKQTECGTDGKLRYVRGAKDLHIIYGYLQVGAILTAKADISKHHWHPHAHMTDADNCLYIPRDTLSWNRTRPGYGVFQYHERLTLTKDGMSKSCWKLPDFFDGLKISSLRDDSWQTDPLGGKYCQIADKRGQEFVIEEHPAVETWARSLIG